MKRPFVLKKSNGFFYICYYSFEGKRRTISTKSRNKFEARVILSDFLNKKKPETEIKQIHLSEYKKIFLDNTSSQRRLNSQRNYIYVINSFLSYSSDKLLSNYTLYDFEKYLNYKLCNKTPETAHLHRRILKVVFDKAVSWNYLNENLILKSIRVRLPETRIKFFTKQEFAKLIESTGNEYFRDLFRFSVLTGMRLNEILNCRFQDVDFENRLIKVYGRKTDKTRFVELHNSLIEIIQRRKGNGYLFKKYSTDYISKQTKFFIKKSGINPGLNFKAFRSSFGKFLLDEGVNLKFISQQLGHSSVRTTEKHYAKYITSEYKGWINRINLL